MIIKANSEDNPMLAANLGNRAMVNNNRGRIGANKAANNNIEDKDFMKRKEQARDKAYKLVSDVFDKDKEFDTGISDAEGTVEDFKKQNKEYMENIQAIRDNRDELKEIYKGSENCEEFKDEMKALDEQEREFTNRIKSNNAAIKGCHEAIEGAKLEKVKDHSMVDATKQAADIMEEASASVVNAIVNDAVEENDKKIEETVEDAKEKAKEEAEEKEKLEEAKAEKEGNKPEPSTDTTADVNYSDVKVVDNKIKNIKDEFKMLDEDIKGIVVDATE